MSHLCGQFVPLHSGQGGQDRQGGGQGGHYGQYLHGGQGRYDGLMMIIF